MCFAFFLCVSESGGLSDPEQKLWRKVKWTHLGLEQAGWIPTPEPASSVEQNTMK